MYEVSDYFMHDLLKATRNNHTNHFGIRIQDLECVGGVAGDRSIITGCQETSLLLCILLSPELEPALKVEEVLVMLLVNMGQNSQ